MPKLFVPSRASVNNTRKFHRCFANGFRNTGTGGAGSECRFTTTLRADARTHVEMSSTLKRDVRKGKRRCACVCVLGERRNEIYKIQYRSKQGGRIGRQKRVPVESRRKNV